MIQVINVITTGRGVIEEVKSFPFETMGMEFEKESAINNAENYFVKKVKELCEPDFTLENDQDCDFVYSSYNYDINLIWSV